MELSATTREDITMATIAVHEFIALDSVFEAPRWIFEYGCDPKMGETHCCVDGAVRHDSARASYV